MSFLYDITDGALTYIVWNFVPNCGRRIAYSTTYITVSMNGMDFEDAVYHRVSDSLKPHRLNPVNINQEMEHASHELPWKRKVPNLDSLCENTIGNQFT